jgi:hypothetical protein
VSREKEIIVLADRARAELDREVETLQGWRECGGKRRLTESEVGAMRYGYLQGVNALAQHLRASRLELEAR